MLRKANVLENKKQGRSGGLGWALEDLFHQNGQSAVITEVVGAVHTSPQKKARMRLKKGNKGTVQDVSAVESGVLGENGFGDTGGLANGVLTTAKEGLEVTTMGATATVAVPVSPSTQGGNFFGGGGEMTE
jgi:hypothetical protein